jgi:hypothetical protein
MKDVLLRCFKKIAVLVCIVIQLLPDRRGGWPESSLSPPTWGGDPLPTSGSGEGDIITPAFRGIVGTTVASLLHGTGGF